MSFVTFVIPSQLRHLIGGEGNVAIEAQTVGEVLGAVAAHSDILKDNLFDEDGKLQRFARLFVNGEPSTFEDGVDQPLANGATVVVLMALVGG